MESTPQKDLASLTEDMKGKDSLGDYDILVSYNQAALNAVLLKRAALIGTIGTLSWSKADKDIWGDDITVETKVELKSPSLQFADEEAHVYFNVPFSGSVKTTRTRDNRAAETKFDKVKVVIVAALSTVRGTTNADGDFAPSPSSTQFKPGAVVLMDPGVKTTYGVCINLPALLSADVKNDTDGTMSADELVNIDAVVKAKLEKKFKDEGLRYCLTAISNDYKPDSTTSLVLQPKEFAFSVAHSDHDGSALSIWVLLKGNPNSSSGSPLPFAPKGVRLNPIPSGRTASIIFSHRVMATHFLVPSLQKSLINVKCLSHKGDDGMKFTYNLPSVEIARVEYTENTTSHCFTMDGFSFNLNHPASNAVLLPSTPDSSAPFKMNYLSNVVKMGWFKQDVIIGMDEPDAKSGTVEAQFSFTGTAQWGQGMNTASHPNRLELNFTFSSTLGVKVTAQSKAWWERLLGGSSSLPPQARDISLPAPHINVDLTTMDYFLTTNLLFPGKYLFRADDPAQTSNTQGIMSPRDTILTGVVHDG